jgi:dTDP-4-amino-4,6-dideoxygalactose transaminase
VTFIAPAGTRLSFADIVVGAFGSARLAAVDELKESLRTAAGLEHAWLMSTGRAAMSVALEAMKRTASDPRRVEVLIPGYTCYSVPAAVERAGLTPRLCDVDPGTLNPDLASLERTDFSRVLAVVSANLYGLPNALQDIEALARGRGIFMLDDAAQALGAAMLGRAAGGYGDVGLFSFDKGKNITTLQGGALVASSGNLMRSLQTVSAGLPAASPRRTVTTLLKLPAYAVLLRPNFYGLIRRLPLGLGATPYEADYPVECFGRALAGVASRQLQRLEQIGAGRVRNAERLSTAVAGVRGLSLMRVLPGASPVYPRFPMLATAGGRDRLIQSLVAAGIGATASYPLALIDVPEVASRLPRDQVPTPGAREVARRIVTLPTHAYCPSGYEITVRDVAARALV